MYFIICPNCERRYMSDMFKDVHVCPYCKWEIRDRKKKRRADEQKY